MLSQKRTNLRVAEGVKFLHRRSEVEFGLRRKLGFDLLGT